MIRFCHVLDGSKTGLTVQMTRFKEDQAEYNRGGRLPNWKEESEERGNSFAPKTPRIRNEADLKRKEGLRPFVMDKLAETGQ